MCNVRAHSTSLLASLRLTVLQDMGAADCTYFGLTVEDDTCTQVGLLD